MPVSRSVWILASILLLVLVVWGTIDTLHDGQMPTLPHLGEFISGSALLLYGVSRRRRVNGVGVGLFRRNIFNRWIIEHPKGGLAWSGSRWVPIDQRGLPAGAVQVCNFESKAEAEKYLQDLPAVVQKQLHENHG